VERVLARIKVVWNRWGCVFLLRSWFLISLQHLHSSFSLRWRAFLVSIADADVFEAHDLFIIDVGTSLDEAPEKWCSKVGTGALLPKAVEDNEDDLIARES